MNREQKILILIEDEERWGEENMRGCNPDQVRETLELLSDEELDFSLRMRGIDPKA